MDPIERNELSSLLCLSLDEIGTGTRATATLMWNECFSKIIIYIILGRQMGFEPMTKRITTSRSTRLNYCRMVGDGRVELPCKHYQCFIIDRYMNRLKFLRGSESNASDNCL